MSNRGGSLSSTEETACVICGGETSRKHNQIVFCDGKDCDIPVHQKCYGIQEVPPGDQKWFCQRCADNVPIKNTTVICCPGSTDGAFKRVVVEGEETDQKKYIHVQCAILHPGIERMDGTGPWIVRDKDAVDEKECLICEKMGLLVNCAYEEIGQDEKTEQCDSCFHVPCAIQEGLLNLNGRLLENDTEIYCNEHRPSRRQLSKRDIRNAKSMAPPRKKRRHELVEESSSGESLSQKIDNANGRRRRANDLSSSDEMIPVKRPSNGNGRRRRAKDVSSSDESSDDCATLGTGGQTHFAKKRAAVKSKTLATPRKQTPEQPKSATNQTPSRFVNGWGTQPTLAKSVDGLARPLISSSFGDVLKNHRKRSESYDTNRSGKSMGGLGNTATPPKIADDVGSAGEPPIGLDLVTLSNGARLNGSKVGAGDVEAQLQRIRIEQDRLLEMISGSPYIPSDGSNRRSVSQTGDGIELADLRTRLAAMQRDLDRERVVCDGLRTELDSARSAAQKGREDASRCINSLRSLRNAVATVFNALRLPGAPVLETAGNSGNKVDEYLRELRDAVVRSTPETVTKSQHIVARIVREVGQGVQDATAFR